MESLILTASGPIASEVFPHLAVRWRNPIFASYLDCYIQIACWVQCVLALRRIRWSLRPSTRPSYLAMGLFDIIKRTFAHNFRSCVASARPVWESPAHTTSASRPKISSKWTAVANVWHTVYSLSYFRKRALLIGIAYGNRKEWTLRGTHGDVDAVQKLLLGACMAVDGYATRLTALRAGRTLCLPIRGHHHHEGCRGCRAAPVAYREEHSARPSLMLSNLVLPFPAPGAQELHPTLRPA